MQSVNPLYASIPGDWISYSLFSRSWGQIQYTRKVAVRAWANMPRALTQKYRSLAIGCCRQRRMQNASYLSHIFMVHPKGPNHVPQPLVHLISICAPAWTSPQILMYCFGLWPDGWGWHILLLLSILSPTFFRDNPHPSLHRCNAY